MSHTTKPPFLMYVPRFVPQGQHMIAEGTIQQGSASPGDMVQVFDMDRHSTVAHITEVELGEPLTHIGIEGLANHWKLGWVIAPPNAISFHKRLRADVTFTTGKGRKALTLVAGYAPLPASEFETMHIKICGATLRCYPEFPHPDLFDYLEAAPGETIKLNVTVFGVIPAKIGYEFQLLEGQDDIIATGIVTDLLD